MKKLILSTLLIIGICGVARADIFNPLPAKSTHQSFLASVNSSNPGNILADASTIVNYLGVKEGEAYQFNQHKWVTTTGATIISYSPWNLSLDIQMLNADGVVASIAWNAGNYLPVNSVPVMQYLQYLYLYGGAGAEENTSDNNAMKIATIAGAEFKFTFGS